MKGPVLGRLYAAFERVIVTRRYDRTIFCSAPSRAAGIAMGADPARSLVVHPGIDTARPAPAATRAPYVLFAGRFDRRKGWHHVVAAARALPDIPFRAFGWGEDIAALRRSAPANLAIADGRSGEGYRAALSEARIFLFPTYAETFGQGVAEAMAGGCAVVSSLDTYRFAGARHAPGDEPAMIRALRRLWDDPAASAAAGEENRRLAAAFTHERHADALLDLYADLLAERGGARRTT
jgi:glycosyltransferase involved in cell wall biosynthesis